MVLGAVGLAIALAGGSAVFRANEIPATPIRFLAVGYTPSQPLRVVPSPIPSNEREAQWIVLGQPKEQTVRIGNYFAWCPGIPSSQPKFGRVKEVDRAHSIILTVFVRTHAPSGCAGVEMAIEKTVHLGVKLDARALYDGSQSPPIKRWPR